jgi:RNA polymerase sigma factor (sigma-70 family)
MLAPDPFGGRPCVSPHWTVYVGVTTRLAIAEPTEITYQRAFEQHWSDVFRFALAWTNDWGAAEDLTQEAYLRLWDHRGRIDWERPVLPWLLVTTRRLATDRFRALRRRLLPVSPPATFDSGQQARWLDVCAAMADLSPLERTALIMTAVEGATYEEAGRVLGTTAGALRAAVSRARTKLEAA